MPGLFDPVIVRRWVRLCVGLAVAVIAVVLLSAAGAVTPWLVWPFFIWFLLAVGGLLLWAFKQVLHVTVPDADDADSDR